MCEINLILKYIRMDKFIVSPIFVENVNKTPPSKEKVNESVQKNNIVNTENKKQKKKRKRCTKCNKKLSLVPFGCRCGNLYCNLCRMPESHNCNFDFKAYACKQIEKENPVVIAKKVEEI